MSILIVQKLAIHQNGVEFLLSQAKKLDELDELDKLDKLDKLVELDKLDEIDKLLNE